MSKNRNKASLALCLMLIGTCSSVFAIDFSQAINQMKTDVFSMGDLFTGKPVVSNIYSKALKLAKDREINSTLTSFDQLKQYYYDCYDIENSDLINILYNSNSSFKQTFDQVLPDSSKKPGSGEINKSYIKFFDCENMTNNLDSVSNLNDEINRIYYDGYSNTYALSTINQDNYGSDLFWNGTLDDSAFDLLYDINQIGKLLFDNFKDTPQILFYRLPTVKTSSNQNTTTSSNNQGSYQVGGGGGSFPGTTGIPNSTGTTSSGSTEDISYTITKTTTNQTSSSELPTNDKDTKKFIQDTNTTLPSTPAGAALLLGNQCLSGDTSTPAEEETLPTQTPEEYIAEIKKFLTGANINDIVDTYLLTVFKQKNPLPPGASTSDSGYAQRIANTYAEQSLGDGVPGSCQYSCKDLPLDKQVKCEFDCAGSCIQKCKGLGLQEQAVCVSDCTCFMLAGPNGSGREGIGDMFRIKFCKVPVQKKSLSPGKTVYTIQAIFQEISDVLEGLRDSGQMVKFSKAKEFLDTNIKIKFADLFAFKLQVSFKPIFAQKSDTIKSKEEQQANADLNLGLLDMNINAPEADDYNKYIVISDPVKNKANLEPATSLADINENIANTAAVSATTTKLSNDTIAMLTKTYAQGAEVGFVQNMISFLQDNLLFRDNMRVALFDMNKMSVELKTKIQAAK